MQTAATLTITMRVAITARMVRGMLGPRIVAREDGEGHTSSHEESAHGQGVELPLVGDILGENDVWDRDVAWGEDIAWCCCGVV